MAEQIKRKNLLNNTGNWFKNIARSTYGVSKDIITDMMPVSMELVSGFKDQVFNLNEFINGNGSDYLKTAKTTADQLKQALSKAKDQIKTGDFSDSDDMFGFDDDFNFDDFDFSFDEDFGGDSTEPQIDEGSRAIQSTMLATSSRETKAIESQTAVVANLLQASTQSNARMSVANTRMLHNVGQQMTAGMQAINSNLSMLVKFQSETMSSYVTASVKFYEDSMNMMKLMADMNRIQNFNNNSSSQDSILSANTIDVKNYVKRVTRNIKDVINGNMVLSTGSMFLDPEMAKMLLSNPLGGLFKGLISSFIPGSFKNASKKLDRSIGNFLPAALSKISGWKDDYDKPVRQLLGNLFGIDTEYKKKVEYKKIDNKQIPYDIETKNYIAANLVYQRKILSALTGNPELMYDVKTNTFTTASKLKEKYENRKKRASMPMDMWSDITTLTQGMSKVDKKMTFEEKDAVREALESFFLNLSQSRTLPDISSRQKIDSLLTEFGPTMTESLRQVLVSVLNAAPNQMKMRMFGSNLIGARESNNAFMTSMENDAGGFDFLFNGADTYNSFVKSKNVKSKRGLTTTSDSSVLFKEKTDMHGMSIYDYLYDIKYLLLKGIRVFPNYRHLDPQGTGGPDPTAHIDRMLRDMHEDTESAAPNLRDYEVFTSNKSKDKKEGILDRIEREKFQNAFYEQQLRETLQQEEDSDQDSKKSLFTRFGAYLQKNTGLNQIGPFRKIAQFSRTASDVVQGAVNDVDNLLFKVLFGFDNSGGPTFYQQFTAEMRSMFGKFKDSVKDSFFGGDNEENAEGKKKGVIQTAISTVANGFNDLSEDIFGKSIVDGAKDIDIKKMGEKFRDAMPKGFAGGVTGAGLSLLGGSLGLLPSLFLPGGPIGATILGSALGFASSSDKFKDFVFGPKDDNNERAGGLISKSFMDTMKKNKKSLIIGGTLGALKSAILGNGVLVGSLLGGGPIGGALVGMGASLAMSSEKFQSLLFGEMGEDGKRDKTTGIISKFTTALSGKLGLSKDKDGKPINYGKAAAGALTGAAGASILGHMGILGGMLTLGGSPILGALAGAAAGITLSSERWTEAIFGTKGEDGKRRGGKVGQIKNWLQINMGEPLKQKIEEYKIESSHWFDTKFADPLRQAIDPLTTALSDAVKTTKDFVTNGLKKMWDKMFNTKSGVIGKYVGKAVRGTGRMALNAADLGIRKTASLAGGLLTAPINLLTKGSDMYNRRRSKKIYNDALDQLYYGDESEDQQFNNLGFFSRALMGPGVYSFLKGRKRYLNRKNRLGSDDSIKLSTKDYLRYKFNRDSGEDFLEDLYGELPPEMQVLDRKRLERKTLKQYKAELKDQYENSDMTFGEYWSKRFSTKDRRAYFQEKLGQLPGYLEQSELSKKHEQEYEARKARLAKEKEQTQLKKEMAKQLGYRTVDQAGKDVSWIYDKDVTFEKDSEGKIKAVRNTVETAVEQKTQAIQMGIAENVLSIESKMDRIVEAIQMNGLSESTSTQDLINAVNMQPVHFNESTEKLANSLNAQDVKEDVEDDAMTYTIAGYDPKTKQKKKERKDVSWLLKNAAGNSISSIISGDEKGSSGEVKESALSKLFNNIMGGAGSIISTFLSNPLLWSGIALLVAKFMPEISELVKNFLNLGETTDAEGNIIENKSFKESVTNVVEGKVVKPIAKKGFKKFGQKGVKEILQYGLTKYIDNDAAEAILKNSDSKFAKKIMELMDKGSVKAGKELAGTATAKTASSSGIKGWFESLTKKISKKTTKEATASSAKKATKEAAEKASSSGIKEWFESLTKKTSKKATKEVAESSAKKATKEAAEKALEKGGETLITTMKDSVKRIFDGSVTAVKKFFTEKCVTEQLGEKACKKASGKVADFFASIGKKILSDDSTVKKFCKKAGIITAEATAGAATGFIIDGIFAAWDFMTGATEAETADMFKVDGDEINIRMRLITGAMKALFGFSYIALIDLGIEIIAVLLGVDPKKRIASWLYGFMAEEEEEKALAVSQKAFEEAKNAYNKKHGTNLSTAQYSDMVNKTFGEKAVEFVKKYASPFSLGTAVANKVTGKSTSSKTTSSTSSKKSSSSSSSKSTTNKDKKSEQSFWSKLVTVGTSALNGVTNIFGFGPEDNNQVLNNQPGTVNGFAYFSQLDNRYANTKYKESPNKGPISSAKTGGAIEPAFVNNFSYFSQKDDRYVNKPYNYNSGASGTVGKRGCGPSSAAMVVKQLAGDTSVNPATMASLATQWGCSTNAGTTWDYFGKVGKKYGLNVQQVGITRSNLSRITPKTPMIISGTGPGTIFGGGHFVVGVKGDNDNIVINDPVSSARSKTYSLNYLQPYMRQGWIFSGGKGLSGSALAEGASTASATANSTSSSPEGVVEDSSDFSFLDFLEKATTALATSLFTGKAVDVNSLMSNTSASSTSSPTSSSASSVGGSVDISGEPDTKRAVWKYFTSNGYTPQATAGIMGNMQQESGINPKSIQGNGKGPAAGICQWENYNKKSARWKNLDTYAKSKGKQWTDLQTQLEFLEKEMNGLDSTTAYLLKQKVGGLEGFKKLTNINKATEVFENSFERAGIKVMSRRQQYANQIYSQYSGGGNGPDIYIGGNGLDLKDFTEKSRRQVKPVNFDNLGGNGPEDSSTMLTNSVTRPSRIARHDSSLTSMSKAIGNITEATASISRRVTDYSNDSYSKYIRQSSVDGKTNMLNNMISTVIRILSNIDTNTAETAANTSKIDDLADKIQSPLTNESITSNLFSTPTNIPIGQTQQQTNTYDRSSMMAKMKLIASGGIK